MQYGESRNMATKTITLTTDDDEEIELIKETLYKLVEIIEKNKINN